MKTAVLLLCIACLCAGSVFASKKKDVKTADSHSVVAGTVFIEPGFALPGAEVTISPVEDEPAAKKSKKMTYTANIRGEFAFHVPAVKARYLLSASAKGFKSQQKTVEVVPEERVDATFTLVAESK